jgi:aminoglycoside phosphotransferase (APT) family kinase protein
VTDAPWTPERAVTAETARRLVESQFPDLAPARLAPLGAGWDNTAFVVNDAWVFRFPRRDVAAGLIETETGVLSALAGRVPWPIPVPERVGRAEGDYPWPFAGYRMLAGRTACDVGLDEDGRAALAEPLAMFLAALHAFPPEAARACGAPPDTIRRLDLGFRIPRTLAQLEQAVEAGLVDDPAPWREIIDATPAGWRPGAGTLVHGDLDGRHVLVDDRGAPSGVIDWGDVHLGDAAVDLAVAHGFLPASAREEFRRAYGPIDEGAWRVARFRAVHTGVLVLLWGRDVGDETLVREGRGALGRVLEV